MSPLRFATLHFPAFVTEGRWKVVVKGFAERCSIQKDLWEALDLKPYQVEAFGDDLGEETQDRVFILSLARQLLSALH